MFKIVLLLLILLNNKSIAKENFKQNFNRPIKIEANEVSTKRNSNVIIFDGKVEATQDNLKIFTDKMYVYYRNNKEIENIKAIGNVILKNEGILATGDEGEYDIKNNLVTLKKNIILTEKDVVVYGEKMTYDTVTQESKMYGETDKKRITIILDDINDLKERYDE